MGHNYSAGYENIINELASLPDHNPGIIDETGQRINRETRFTDDPAWKPLIHATQDDVLKMIHGIADMDFDGLKADLQRFEPPYQGGSKTMWCEDIKLVRMRILIERYRLIHRLRSQDTEAWSEI